jgi:hypothetical protein
VSGPSSTLHIMNRTRIARFPPTTALSRSPVHLGMQGRRRCKLRHRRRLDPVRLILRFALVLVVGICVTARADEQATRLSISAMHWYESNALGERYDKAGARQYHAFAPQGRSDDSHATYLDLYVLKNGTMLTLEEADCNQLTYRGVASGVIQPSVDSVQMSRMNTITQTAAPESIEGETIRQVCGLEPLKNRVANPITEGQGWVFAPQADADARAHQRWENMTPAERRREMVNDMLTKDSAHDIENERWLCATGQAPDDVAQSRKDGNDDEPDASDSCVMALIRSARDHVLPDLYRKVIVKLGGDVSGYDKLPRLIGASVLTNHNQVAIGNGKAAVVGGALAFDAGFVVAYQDAAPKKEGNAQRLKELTEACLGNGQDAGTCFSIGYVQGSLAINAGQ